MPATHVSIRSLALPLLFLASFAAVLFFPLPDSPGPTLIIRLAEASLAHNSQQIAVVGTSVVAHVSSCDADKRGIAEMLRDDSGRNTIDLSFGGQVFSDSLNFATLALRSPNVSSVVYFLSTSQLLNEDDTSLQAQLFFRLASGSYHANDLVGRLRRGDGLTAAPQVYQTPFTYKGASYPDYNGRKTQFFAVEKQRQACPESLGHNRTFIEAGYWNSYARADARANNTDDLARLAALGRSLGKRVLLVVLPIDFQDIESLNPELGQTVRQSATTLSASLREAGVDTVDLSDLGPGDLFSDRWCACGHLLADGRQRVAEAATAGLRTQAAR